MCVWNIMINELPAWSQDTAQPSGPHLGPRYCQVVWFPPRLARPGRALAAFLACLLATSLGSRDDWWPAQQQPGSETRHQGASEPEIQVQSFNHLFNPNITHWHNEQNGNYSQPHSWPAFDSFHDAVLDERDDNVHIYVYIISTTRTMSAASADCAYLCVPCSAVLTLDERRGGDLRDHLEAPVNTTHTHLTAKYRKLRDELERRELRSGNKNIVLSFHVSVELI